MKTRSSLVIAVVLGLSLLVLSGCGKHKGTHERTNVPRAAKTFSAFSSLKISYIDEYGEKKDLPFYRNEAILDMLSQLQKAEIPEDADPVEKHSLQKLRYALQQLYGKNADQSLFRAVALLRELADVKKPYAPDNWKRVELECHMVAKYVLSLCYQDGVGVPKDLDKGLNLLKEACFYDQFGCYGDRFGWGSDLDDVASPLAALEMSVRLLGGIDVNPHLVKGIVLLDYVQDNGNAIANSIQKKLYEVLPRDQSVFPERFQHYETPKRMIYGFEGVSVLDITKMLARERKSKEE